MPSANEAVQPNAVDRTAMFLDTYDSGHSTTLALPFVLLIGGAAGLGVKELVDSQFITNHAYATAEGHIEQLQTNQANLIHASHVLSSNGITAANPEVAEKLQKYTTEIKHDKAMLPHNYQPHLEGLADFGSLAVTGIFVAGALYKGIKHYSRRGKARIAALKDATPDIGHVVATN